MSDDQSCPICGGALATGYGFAGGGGIGPYRFCLACDELIDKRVDVPGECFHAHSEPDPPDLK